MRYNMSSFTPKSQSELIQSTSQRLSKKEAVNTVKHDFYVDNLLKSQKTEEYAIDLVTNVRELCTLGGLKLTKFISNSRRVLETIMIEDHVNGLKDLHHSEA